MTEQEIFTAALEKQSAAERAAFLEGACGSDTARREHIEGLLRERENLNSFLDRPPAGIAIAASPTVDRWQPEQIGTQIGRYKLLEQVGEGGMGVVFVAEQTEPVRRRVALKIIKPGMDTKQVIARFEAERQALAMMDHPNIARVLDAGTTDVGRPYFVMELVRGMPITEYCDKAKLSPRQRLELFVDVCQAVQHAHQKGIIHRDLKPSNVMVTMQDGHPVVKVIDFGVAKAVGQQLTERTVYTALTQLVGTPLYMSPEQAELTSHDVDTRSDVYSLGVLLYELLTGQTPFDKETLAKAGLDEMRRIIREDEPLRPSRRLSTLGAAAISTATQHRGVDERRLSKILCGELDWIVMKALEKDRSRRYESASSLAADIQRYLSDEPVLACPPTTMYRFQKFARKHKPALVTAAAIAACLLLGTTVSAWQAVRATTAEAQANANERKAVENQQKANANAVAAQLKEQEATKERDEVKSLNAKLAAKEQQLQRTLYAANMKLAKVAWDEAAIHQVQELLDQHRPKTGEQDLRGFEWHYLDRLCHSELLTLKGRSAAFSPDGKLLARVGENGVVVLRNLQSGKDLFTLKRGDRPVFSPDGMRLASGGSDVKVLDVQTGKALFSVPGAGRIMRAVVFTPDGKWLAAGTSGWDEINKVDVAAEVKVWDASNGQELFTSKGHAVGGGVWSLAFSPDGKLLASGSADKTVKIWDAKTGQELLTLKGHNDSVDHVAFTPDASRLVSGAYRTVKMWDVQTGKEIFTLQGGNSRLALSSDGRRLATASVGGLVKLWDAQTGEELHSLQHASYTLDFSPNGKRLASGSGDRTVKLWDVETGHEVLTFKGHPNIVTDISFDPSGTRLASTSIDGTVKVWDATTNPEARTMSDVAGTVRNPLFSPDGQLVAGIVRDPNSQSYAVKVWNVQTRQVVRTLNGKHENLRCLAVSRDGKRFAAGTGQWDNAKNKYVGGDVRIWDAQTGRELLTFKAYETAVNRLAISPDGTLLATGDTVGGAEWSKGGEVKLWDALTGQQLLEFKGHTASINDLAFSPDGKRLATHSLDSTVKIWDVETGQVILTITPVALLPDRGGISFSPDGKRLAGSGRASASGAGPAAIGEVKVWDAQTGDELHTLKGHTLGVSSVVYSPDGKRLASASGGAAQASGAGEVKVWDAENGKELLTLKGGVFGHRIAFSPDGTQLASDAGGSLKIYDAAPLPEKP